MLSCGARRMVESAALLVDELLPQKPIGQWVLTVLFPLRFLKAWLLQVKRRILCPALVCFFSIFCLAFPAIFYLHSLKKIT